METNVKNTTHLLNKLKKVRIVDVTVSQNIPSTLINFLTQMVCVRLSTEFLRM